MRGIQIVMKVDGVRILLAPEISNFLLMFGQ